jgi:hypothetical protein
MASKLGIKCRKANVKPMETSWKDKALGWVIIL